MTTNNSILYRPEIDGLRAVAVLAVILYHAGVPGFDGGFVGIDVFFVISGYLITSLIVTELDAGTFSLRRFYGRRARRILPALLLVTAVVAATAWVMLPLRAKDAYQSVVAVLGMSSNLLFWKESGYFNAEAELKPLLHTWSLAVEEQFYLLYPLGLLALWKFGRGRGRLLPALGLIGLASFAAAQWAAQDHPDTAFYLLPMRAWELLAGAAVAHVLPLDGRRPLSRCSAEIGALVGLTLIVVAILGYNETRTAALWLAVPVMGAALVLGCAREATWVGRILRITPLHGIGLISYSAYLIHQPLFAYVRYSRPSGPEWPVMLGLIALTLGLAWASWRFIEQPFRNAEVVGRRAAAVVAVVGIAAVGIVGVAGAVTRGFESIVQGTLDARAARIYGDYVRTADVPPPTTYGEGCRFNLDHVSPRSVEKFENCAARYGKAVIILGDSHAQMLHLAVMANSDRPFVAGAIEHACQLSRSPFNVCQYRLFAAFVHTHVDQIERIVYVQSTTSLLKYAQNPAPIERMIDYLSRLPPGIEIVVTGPQVEPFVRVPSLVTAALHCDMSVSAVAREQIRKYVELDAALKQRFAAQTRLHYLSLIDSLQFDPRTDLYDCDAVFWRDQNHWSEAGQKRFGQRLLKAHPELVE